MEFDAYLVARWAHILSSTLLFGTGIGTAFQMVWAMRSRKADTIASVASGVVVADWCFTVPSGIVQPLSGVWLILLQGHDPAAPWLVLSYALYVVALLCWLPVVGLQIRIRDLARAAARQGHGTLPDAAWRAYRIWFALGWPAFAALVAIFWLMVSKPQLW